MKYVGMTLTLVLIAGMSYALVGVVGERIDAGIGGGKIGTYKKVKDLEPVPIDISPTYVSELDPNSAVGLLQSLADDLAGDKKEYISALKYEDANLLLEAAAAIGNAENPRVRVGFSSDKEGNFVIDLKAADLVNLGRKYEVLFKPLANLEITLNLSDEVKEAIANIIKKDLKNYTEIGEKNVESIFDLLKKGEVEISSQAAREIVNTIMLNLHQVEVLDVVDMGDLIQLEPIGGKK